MTRAELKKEAKQSLKGRWGTVIGMILLYEILLSIISMAAGFIPVVGSLAVFVISVPLSFGFVGQIMKFSRNEEVGLFDYFSIGFKNFTRSWSIVGNTLLKLLGIIIPFIIVGFLTAIGFAVFIGVFFGVAMGGISVEQLSQVESILGGLGIVFGVLALVTYVLYICLLVKSYLYILTNYIGNDNQEMSGKEIVEKSKMLMKGNRWEYFVLNLSFIGWILLSVFTLGIGLLWLIPYMEVTNVKFYENIVANNDNNNNDNNNEVIVNN